MALNAMPAGLIAAMCVAAGCASIATPLSQPSWCNANEVQFDGVRLPGSSLWLVGRDKIPEAVAMLARRSVVPLPSAADATRLTLQPAAGASSNYYLLRAGVLAPAGSTPAELQEAAKSAHLSLGWTSERNRVLVQTAQITRGPVQPFNIAVVANLDAVIEAAGVVCQSIE